MERITGTGVWAGELRHGDPGEIKEAAAELDQLGYSALWIPDIGGEVFAAIELLLGSTHRAVAATGILNLWMHDPEVSAAEHARLTATYGDRFLVGIGVSHQPLIDSVLEPGRYRRPIAAMESYLDRLDAADPPLDRADRVLAALGPRMLDLARTRAAGAHPYHVPPEHTALARRALGPGPLLAPEQAVILSTDPETARSRGREHFRIYAGLPNYTGNLQRLGFDETDFAGGGSDRLIDALYAWGDVEAIAARVAEHRDAGADHVCIQVVGEEGMPRRQWRELAPALTG